MTALKSILLRQITAQGPISVAEYMTLCLLHPKYGYYPSRDPFGTGGDFITAPEVSQMFGELLGLFMAQVWLEQGSPAPFTLAELGPGRGTLMADMLRATQKIPGFHASLQLHLVEASPVLQQIQADRLAAYAPMFHQSADALPDQPLYLIANEFFDALPIRQFMRIGDGWAERVVAAKDGDLCFGLTPPAHLAALSHRLPDTSDGMMVELCAPALPVMEALQTRIKTFGGVALIIDYGDWRSRGDTLQAMRQHAYDDPLAHPGEADLTAHVDFEALARASAPLRASPLTPQGAFLRRLGLEMRAAQLAQNLSGPALQLHQNAYRRLTHAEEMGHLFKVMGLVQPTAPTLPGLDG